MRYLAPILLLAVTSLIPLIYARDCKSSGTVTCHLKDESRPVNNLLSCIDHLKIRKADCPLQESVVNTTVMATFKFCNENDSPIVQRPRTIPANETFFSFKNEDIEIPNEGGILNSKECRSVTIEKEINLCGKGGIRMRGKYEGDSCQENVRSVSGNNCASNPWDDYFVSRANCYNFTFFEEEKEWLPPVECSIESTVNCFITETGEPCKGNIILNAISDPPCSVSVTFQYEVCNYYVPSNSSPSEDNSDFIFNDSSSMTLRNVNLEFNKENLSTKERCRSQTLVTTINTCNEMSTVARFAVEGHMDGAQGGDVCTSDNTITVQPVYKQECNFFITEIADPYNVEQNRYIEIYTRNYECRGKDITEDQYLVIYNSANRKPSSYASIRLKGKTVANDGFIVFCATNEGKIYYGARCDYVTGEESPADSSGRDQLAIIKGTFKDIFTGNNVLAISDLYGVIGKSGTGTSRDFRDGRVVRAYDTLGPNGGSYLDSNFLIENDITSSMTDPHVWSQSCGKPNFVITEVADTLTRDTTHFVEIFSAGCKGQVINGDYKLKAYTMSSGIYTETGTEINLDTLLVPGNGFLVFCAAGGKDIYGIECNTEEKLVSTGGCNQTTVAITLENKILDVYGTMKDSTENESLYKGRAVRMTDKTGQEPIFDKRSWVVIPNEPYTNTDPQEWLYVTFSPEPTLSPEPFPRTEISTFPPTVPLTKPYYGACPDVESNIIITEITSNYIELYHLNHRNPDCEKEEFPTSLTLAVYDDTGAEVSGTVTTVPGFFNISGLIVTYLVEKEFRQGTASTIALRKPDPGGGLVPIILDQFGVLGTTVSESNCANSINYCMVGGSAVRKKSVTRQNADFPQSSECAWLEWDVYTSAEGRPFDPLEWQIEESCSFDFVITEVADPGNSPDLQFIEVYTTECKGRTIHGDYSITTYTTNEIPINRESICLNTLPVPQDGFLVFCRNYDSSPAAVYGNNCDYSLDIDLEGESKVAIYQNNNMAYTILDAYGIHEFSEGRVVRKIGCVQNHEFNIENWIIRSPQTAGDTDPHQWIDIVCPDLKNSIIITEIVAPHNMGIRYIELYNMLHTQSGSCNQAYIDDYLTLDVLDENGNVKGTINLQGRKFSPDGFIVLCSSDSANKYYSGKCTHIIKDNASAASTDGKSSTIVLRDIGLADSIVTIDRFGVLGSTTSTSNCGDGNNYCFDGRSALRKKSVTTKPNDNFFPHGFSWTEWEIHNPGTRLPDPGVWENSPYCEFDFIITEITDPHAGYPDTLACGDVTGIEIDKHESSVLQFIEIYSEKCKGKEIHGDYSIMVSDTFGIYSHQNLVANLDSMVVPLDGLLVFCTGHTLAYTTYGAKCDYNVASFEGKMDGQSIVTITKLNADNSYTSLDTYGTELSDASTDFSAGRAVRRLGCKSQMATFDISNWIIRKPELVEDTDPHEWKLVTSPCTDLKEHIVITEIVDTSFQRKGYIELYNLKHGEEHCSEATILDFLTLDIFRSDGTIASSVNLRGMVFSENGFIVLCLDGLNVTQCAMTLANQFTIEFANDVSTIALQGFDLLGEREMIDKFGVIGNSESKVLCNDYCSNAPYPFCDKSIDYCLDGGSAVRKKNITPTPDPQFLLSIPALGPRTWFYWDIHGSNRYPDLDVWADPFKTSPPTSPPTLLTTPPTTPPTSYPTLSPSLSRRPSPHPTCIGKGCSTAGKWGKGGHRNRDRNLRYA